MKENEDQFSVITRDLTRRFGKFTAVDKVNIQIRKGEIFGFLGPNGAGKSTIIKMLCGILPPTSGIGIVAGFNISRESEKIKLNIGYMSQKFSLYEDLTVEENIDFYSGIYCIPKEKKSLRKEWVIKMAGLQEHRKNKTASLSGGWKQRLALGCAILHEPPILFLDEPTSGVDPNSRRNFWELIYTLADSGVTIFVTTHYMDEAEYCHRLALIYKGKIIAEGTQDELKKEMSSSEVYELVCDNLFQAVERVVSIRNVKEAALFGNSIHVVFQSEELDMDSFRLEMENDGYEIKKLEKITPAMEDVFVSLIERSDRLDNTGKGQQ